MYTSLEHCAVFIVGVKDPLEIHALEDWISPNSRCHNPADT